MHRVVIVTTPEGDICEVWATFNKAKENSCLWEVAGFDFTSVPVSRLAVAPF